MKDIQRNKYTWRVMLVLNSVIILINIFFPESAIAETIKESSTKGKEMIPFYWMVFIVGSCIAVTLSYVGWRKYKGEKNKEKTKDKSVD